MAVLKMQRLTVCALKKDRKAILEKLQSMGVLQVDPVSGDDRDFRKMDTAGQRMGFEKAAASADQALDILDKYVPEKKSVFSALEGRKVITTEMEAAVRKKRKELLRTARQICDLDRDRAEQLGLITKLENSIESLEPWMNLDVPVKTQRTRRTVLMPGTMPGGTTTEEIYQVLAGKAPQAEGTDIHIISEEQNMVYLTVLCMKEEARQVEDALRSAGFARPSQTWDDVPAYEKQELLGQIRDCRQKIRQTEEQIADLAQQREQLKIVADYYRVRADKYAVLGELPQSRRTFIISGYIPRCESDYVAGYLLERYDCAVDVEELREDEEAPVILKNNPFSANMEGIVESYGLPHKGEIDPTTVMSFFYIFFFGMMLSDAAYGALVALVCGILVRKFPGMSPGMKKSLKLFFYCGLSTLVWGILFGGYFGNIVDIVSEKFFGHTVYGSRQLGHKSLFRNIYFFLIAQGFNSMDNRFHRADDPGSSHPIDNNDKDQIKDQKFQDQIKEIPDQIIVKSRPHQFKIPVLGEAQKQKILPLCRRCGRIVLDISPDSPGNFSQSIMPGDFLGQIPAGPDHIPCIILYQDSPGSGLFQRFLSFF